MRELWFWKTSITTEEHVTVRRPPATKISAAVVSGIDGTLVPDDKARSESNRWAGMSLCKAGIALVSGASS
jgi:hypothetical protein